MASWFKDYIQGLSSAEYHLQVSLLFLFMCFVLYKIYKTYHLFRFINDTATSKIASAAQGYVELKGIGELLPGPSIISPFSGRRCLWFQCIVEKKAKMGKSTNWVEESNKVSDQLFHIQDETGLCIIIPEGAFVIPSEQTHWYGNGLQSRRQGRLKSLWINRYIGFGNYRFTEKLITIADPLFVCGLFKSEPKNIDTEFLQDKVNALLARWKSNPDKYLTAFHVNKNAKIEALEWERIRQYAVELIRKSQQQAFHHTVQQPLEKNQPFVISAISEKALLNKKIRLLILYGVLFLFLLVTLVTTIKVH